MRRQYKVYYWILNGIVLIGRARTKKRAFKKCIELRGTEIMKFCYRRGKRYHKTIALYEFV